MAEESQEKSVKTDAGSTGFGRTEWVIVSAVVAVFILAYVAAAWLPDWVRAFFNVTDAGAEGVGKFSVFGPIGDFFGGIINPILTFITIFLLLHNIKLQRSSIKIQQEELQATRDEMQAATDQAKISANAAQASILINKIAERPYLVVMGYEATFYLLLLKIRNYGKSTAIIKNITIYLNYRNVRKKINDDFLGGLIVEVYIDGNNSSRVSIGIMDEKFMDSKFGNILLGHKNSKNMSIDIEISYSDYFMQEWVTVVRCEADLNGNGFNIDPGRIYSDRSEALDTLAKITEASKLHGENRNGSRPSRLHPDR